MSKYYYLIAGLPELSLEDSKISYTVADFKKELYPDLSSSDKKRIDLFYLQYDNANVLKLLKNKDAEIDLRGKYSSEELIEHINTIKEGGVISKKQFPTYLSDYISSYFASSGSDDDSVLREDSLATAYYDYAMKCDNKFVADWFELNLNVNNILVALTARKYKIDVAQNIVGNTDVSEALRTSGARDFGLTGEVDYFDRVVKLSEIDDLLEREKKIDSLRWDWLEENTFFHYFTLEKVFSFLIKLSMIERWLMLDKEKGKEMFRNMIDSLKDEVQIPAEFK